MDKYQRKCRINSHYIHVETYAAQDPISKNVKKNPPVIFLHHGLGSTRSWRDQVHAFSAAGYRTILYDRWGYGKSEARPNLAVPNFTEDLADLHALIGKLKIQQAILIGHSDGGSIGLYYAARYPEQVYALVTVAAHIYLESKMEPSFQGIRQAFEQDQRFRAGLLRTHGEKFESTFVNWFDGWYSPATKEWNMRPWLPSIRCPTLVIQGEDDEYTTNQHAIDIAENIKDAELWLVSGAKHMLPQEIPGEFNQKVLTFLKHL